MPLRADGQHDDQHGEGDRVDQRARQQLAAPRLDEPEQQAAVEGPGHVAEPAEDGRDEAEQREAAGVGGGERAHRADGRARRAGQRGGEAERDRVDVRRLDAHRARAAPGPCRWPGSTVRYACGAPSTRGRW